VRRFADSSVCIERSFSPFSVSVGLRPVGGDGASQLTKMVTPTKRSSVLRWVGYCSGGYQPSPDAVKFRP